MGSVRTPEVVGSSLSEQREAIRSEELCGSPQFLQANTGATIASSPIITQIDAM
jgi:hypothetical protein